MEGGKRGCRQTFKAQCDGLLEVDATAVGAAQAHAGQGQALGGIGHPLQCLGGELRKGAALGGGEEAADELQGQGQAAHRAGELPGSGGAGGAGLGGQGLEEVVSGVLFELGDGNDVAGCNEAPRQGEVPGGQQVGAVGAAAVQVLGRLELPGVVDHQQHPPLADGVGHRLAAALGGDRVGDVLPQGLAPGGEHAHDIRRRSETAPQHPVAEVLEELGMVGQHHRQGALAHPRQALDGDAATLETPHQHVDQGVPALHVARQRRHVDPQRRRGRLGDGLDRDAADGDVAGLDVLEGDSGGFKLRRFRHDGLLLAASFWGDPSYRVGSAAYPFKLGPTRAN